MASIAEAVNRLINNIANSLDAVANGGVTVPEGANSDNLPDLIAQLYGGSGGGGVSNAITDCDYLFYYGTRAEQFEATLNAIDYIDRAYLMFADFGRNSGAVPVSELPDSFYDKLKKATYVCSMFNYAYAFSRFDGITFENTVNVQNFITNTRMTYIGDITIPEAEGNSIAGMLYGNSLLETVGNITVGDNAVVLAGGLFDGCVALKTIGSLNFKPSGSAQNMFRSCRALEKAPQLDWSECTSLYGCFAGCTSMAGEITIGISKINGNSGCQGFTNCWALEGILQLHTLYTGNLRGFVPIGTADASSALKRLTFHPECAFTGLEGFTIAYCSFDRAGMVEFFESLPDLIALESTSTSTYRAITITGNPCVTGGSLTDTDRAIATDKGWTLVE